MELRFEKLDHQQEAIESVISLFQGEPSREQVFKLYNSSMIFANELILTSDEIGKNLNKVQQKFNQNKTRIDEHGLNFSIEMETGTGKTYVYLRTIFELNRKYGWQKFIIVVPSVAIREGVLQSIKAMEKHFEAEFNKPIFRHSTYSSSRLNDMHSFATNNNIEILIINIDAFNKDDNVINRVNEKGTAPILFIGQTRPIVIIDEPQNMETDLAKQALSSLNPLFTLRYSATHKNPYHKIYSLNPIKAYNENLVKRVEVESISSRNDVNNAYLVLKSFETGKRKLSAKVEILFNDKKEMRKRLIKVCAGDDLFTKSGENESYRNGFIINGLDAESGKLSLSSGTSIALGEGDDVVNNEIMKKQIECTIKEHLAKEKRLNPLGIKVLSLFFIDKVANYRNDGKFAQWFEKIYEHETGESAKNVHDGYFSEDRQKNLKTGREKEAATYDLIMKDKEKLLSFDSPLRFIFSHSALKEGWDNPNVFQICTLNETHSLLKKRQEIGRGLRLAVNQYGERVRDENVNILTVIPNESYESFAKNLQQEYQDECGIEFENGGAKPRDERLQQKFRKGFTLDPIFLEIWQRLQRKTRYSVEFEREKLIEESSALIRNMPEIQKPELITQKAKIAQTEAGISSNATHYQSHAIDIDWAIPDVLREIERKTELTRKTIFEILEKSGRIGELVKNPQRFVDLASEKILLALHGLMIKGIKYEREPEKDSEIFAQSLLRWKELESGGAVFFKNEHTFLINTEKSKKTIFANYISLDSDTEMQFARDCESYESVRFYFKLPRWFKIETPIGSYNPDWAVVIGDCENVYFIAETKNSGRGIQAGVDLDKLNITEQQKIECAKNHFSVFDGVNYRVVQSLSELKH